VLLERVALPERTLFRKIADPEKLRWLLESHDTLSPFPLRDGLHLDTSKLPPAEAARRIVAHYSLPLVEEDTAASGAP
jgi:hypothetical protein